MFSQRGGGGRGGTGIGAAFEHLLCQTAVLFFHREGYFITFELFSCPYGWEFDQKIAN